MNEHDEYIIDTQMLYVNADYKEWIQQDGESLLIWKMNEAHLKNSIKKIEKDIKTFKDDVSAIVIEKAEKKLQELKTAYRNRI